MRADKGLLLPLAIIFILAFVIRIYPAIFSPYPYNIDGLGEAMRSGDILQTGALSVPPDAGYWNSYIVDMPFFDVLVAAISSLVGISPLLLAQSIVAVIGALSCVAAALVVHMVTKSRRASILAGMFLALLGTYVFCTGSGWKESLGLSMMVIIAGLILMRKDIRFRALLTVALFMMVFVHHHSAVLTFLLFTFAAAGDGYLALKDRRWSWGNGADVATALALWVLTVVYYSGIDLPYYSFLRPETDLYLLIALIAAMILILSISLSRRRVSQSRNLLKIGIPALAVFLLVLNHFRPIFTGIPGTETSLLVFVVSYAVLVIPMWFGSSSLLIPGQKSTTLMFAAIFAPLTMILFGFLRGLDPTSHMIIYRTFDFLDLGMAALFGTGVVIMIRNFKQVAPVLVTLLLLILASTAPLAFQTQGLFGVENQTYAYEVDAYGIMDSISSSHNISSDQRMSNSIGWLYNFSGGSDLAYRIDAGMSISGFHWLVAENSWTTTGAQEFPLANRVLDGSVFGQFFDEQNVILIAGPTDTQLIAAIATS